MCLHVLEKSLYDTAPYQPIKVARADITVWKILTIYNLSPFQRFIYKPNTLYRLRKPLVITTPVWTKRVRSINEGFHAYLDKSNAAGRIGQFYDTFKVVKLTIPKGAKYVLGQNDDIVSTSIRSGSLEPIKG